MAAWNRISTTFSTYHRENLLLKGQANWPPTVGSFLPGFFWLLGNQSLSAVGGAELLFLIPGGRVDSWANAAWAAHTRPGPAGWLGTLRTLLGHLQRRLGLAGIGQRRLYVGHGLAGWRHSGNGTTSENSGTGRDGNGGRAVMITESWWVVVWESNEKRRWTGVRHAHCPLSGQTR